MAVETFKKVRNILGLTRYGMAKELGISQTQYDYLEQKAKSAQTKVLQKAIKLWESRGRSAQEFWDIFKTEPL